jgi:hypothetical protein
MGVVIPVWAAARSGETAGDGRGLEAAHVLKPAHVLLDVRACGRQRIQVLVRAPGQEGPQVGLGVQPRGTPVPTEVGRGRCTQNDTIRRDDNGTGSGRGSHTSRCVTAIIDANALRAAVERVAPLVGQSRSAPRG